MDTPNIEQLMLTEQKTTNELLERILTQERHKQHQETRRFWLGLFFHALPFIIIAILVWYVYQFIGHQVAALQSTVNEIQQSTDISDIKDKIESFFN